ncbi:MAG: DinB family protein [Actinomycetota bacterium]|nr:DinB family protein [Actinomycetota bacterium]
MPAKDELVALSDYVWQRTSGRLAGLSDEEYLWEPVPGCWTIRDRGDGCYVADGVQPAPHPPPFTTIAWRLAHLTGCYGADRNGRFLHVALAPAVLDPAGVLPATGASALDRLARAHARWRAHVSAVPPEAMTERLGPVAGPFAEGTLAGFVLHMLDEFIHHGAELALLRDLYTAKA